jgi:hypothetical protein
VANKALLELDLSWNAMRPLAAEAIARALNTNYVLQRLSVAWNGAGLPPALLLGYWACRLASPT